MRGRHRAPIAIAVIIPSRVELIGFAVGVPPVGWADSQQRDRVVEDQPDLVAELVVPLGVDQPCAHLEPEPAERAGLPVTTISGSNTRSHCILLGLVSSMASVPCCLVQCLRREAILSLSPRLLRYLTGMVKSGVACVPRVASESRARNRSWARPTPSRPSTSARPSGYRYGRSSARTAAAMSRLRRAIPRLCAAASAS